MLKKGISEWSQKSVNKNGPVPKKNDPVPKKNGLVPKKERFGS